MWRCRRRRRGCGVEAVRESVAAVVDINREHIPSQTGSQRGWGFAYLVFPPKCNSGMPCGESGGGRRRGGRG
ncbi:hypothetical protein [Oryza sativa Japonica Group]|uniref:Uncharacterized protein n=1 Tax=Oryza sativa subsp. japonica TaxID=39947 RepID=Q94CX5_ORYSJ|nr:hypothetical protein [Oryza sativa Japonica Group]BAB92786.1 hypothetical protein [Oryza sativa Japonica Group]